MANLTPLKVSRIILHALFFLSGAAALGYQLVWAKMFSTGLGHEMPAVLAIIAAFMVGMALGAAWLDRFIPRDARAGRWLAGLELTIGVWAVIASFAIPHANEWALQLIGLAPSAGKHWLVAFAIPAVTLLPATVAMGATFPAMEKFLSVVAPRTRCRWIHFAVRQRREIFPSRERSRPSPPSPGAE